MAPDSLAHLIENSGVSNMVQEKHPRSICIVNYKGGVGKTTLSCLLGHYLAQTTKKRVLLFDIDPQCSLSLALGFDPDRVSKTELTIYNLVRPSKWTKITKTNFESYSQKVKAIFAPQNLYIVPGSFDTDTLDFEIAKTLIEDEKQYTERLFLYAKQVLMAFSDYEYVIVDCPPNKMFLTQAMLRACSFYAAVTIPDQISIYGMPRLIRWIHDIPKSDKPWLLGYILNAQNRAGGKGVISQQVAESDLQVRVKGYLTPAEKAVIGDQPCLGSIPRLDVVAKFLGGTAVAADLTKRTSNQPTVDECLGKIRDRMIDRMNCFYAKK